jgi:hypothetical protein
VSGTLYRRLRRQTRKSALPGRVSAPQQNYCELGAKEGLWLVLAGFCSRLLW